MQIHYLSEENSILNHFLGQIRNVNVQKDSMRFRRNIERIGEVMSYELSKNLHYKNVDIQTPLGIKKTTEIEDELVLCAGISGIDVSQLGLDEELPTFLDDMRRHMFAPSQREAGG